MISQDAYSNVKDVRWQNMLSKDSFQGSLSDDVNYYLTGVIDGKDRLIGAFDSVKNLLQMFAADGSVLVTLEMSKKVATELAKIWVEQSGGTFHVPPKVEKPKTPNLGKKIAQPKEYFWGPDGSGDIYMSGIPNSNPYKNKYLEALEKQKQAEAVANYWYDAEAKAEDDKIINQFLDQIKDLELNQEKKLLQAKQQQILKEELEKLKGKGTEWKFVAKNTSSAEKPLLLDELSKASKEIVESYGSMLQASFNEDSDTSKMIITVSNPVVGELAPLEEFPSSVEVKEVKSIKFDLSENPDPYPPTTKQTLFEKAWFGDNSNSSKEELDQIAKKPPKKIKLVKIKKE